MIPTYNLVYFKNVLNICFGDFFAEYGDCFAKQNGKYVFTGGISYNAACKWFIDRFKGHILRNIRPFDLLKPEYYVIIGGCLPCDNLLFDFRDSRYFPKKLELLIQSRPTIRYILKERDIEMDMEFMNRVFDGIFKTIFRKGGSVFGENYRNVAAICHNRLDCYAMFKILKFIYGAVNCVNMSKGAFKDDGRCLVSINDLVKSYITNRQSMNRSSEFKNAVSDIRRYLEQRRDEFKRQE